MENTIKTPVVEDTKAKKAAAAKRFAENQKAKKAATQEAAKKVLDFLASKKIELPADLNKALNDIANPVAQHSSGTSSLFTTLFGATPKVGTSVTLIDVFNKTFKGKAEIDRAVKKWAEKGIVVEFKQAAKLPESTYTIKALSK